MTSLSSNEVTKLCQDLVYQVAYAFYDTPYILLLKLLTQHDVLAERAFAEMLLITPNELRRYMGILHVHHLVKRYVNKEKLPPETFIRNRQALPDGQLRTKDVIYWYLDYREFANVAKYRIAMMRKAIDEKIKQELGHRGYICPSCNKTYQPLDVSHLFDPVSNVLACEQCASELLEWDPSVDNEREGQANQDKMQRFNAATLDIREALKAVEGTTIPSLNVVSWIALNVKTAPLPGEETGEGGKEDKYKVIIGGEGDEKAQLEKARLAEAQRVQNALPVWHTHSTVTGSATALGLGVAAAAGSSSQVTAGDGKDPTMDHAAVLEAHYAALEAEDEDEMDEVEEVETPVKAEPVDPSARAAVVGGDEEEDEDDDMEDLAATGENTPAENGTGVSTPANGDGPVLTVNGVRKALEDITDEDGELMTKEEYEAWWKAMEGS